MTPATPGRIVLYSDMYGSDRPAWVAGIADEGEVASLLVLNYDCTTERQQFVGYWDYGPLGRQPLRFWRWMPFQKGQASKLDDHEPRLKALEELVARLAAQLDGKAVVGPPEQPR